MTLTQSEISEMQARAIDAFWEWHSRDPQAATDAMLAALIEDRESEEPDEQGMTEHSINCPAD